MKTKLSLVVACCVLTGCVSNSHHSASNFRQSADKLQEEQAPVSASAKFSNDIQSVLLKHANKNSRGNVLAKNINFYVRGLMQDLVGNLQYVNPTTPVAVTSFILLDGEYNETNLLGNQISESLIHEVHKFGIPVIDFKTTDAIRVTKHGDFIFSRDKKKLKGDLPIRYIFGGTIVKHQGGYLVNARVVGVTSKAVVASAQSYIPADVAAAILNGASRRKSGAGKAVTVRQG